MMEASPEDETLAGAFAKTEELDHGEDLKASEEAITFMSSIGELIMYYRGGYCEVTIY